MMMFHPHVCTWCVQKLEEESVTLEMKFQMVVSHHVSAGTRTQILSLHPPTSLPFCLHLCF